MEVVGAMILGGLLVAVCALGVLVVTATLVPLD